LIWITYRFDNSRMITTTQNTDAKNNATMYKIFKTIS